MIKSMDKLVGLALIALGALMNIEIHWWTGASLIEPGEGTQVLGWLLVAAGIVYLFRGQNKP
ncbi:MAG TPA: hypothetical protein VNA16_00075 [Abditibacteriaceae bacterium]|nr:hypothetical protein [Abditibacteriaceae bacterium]